MDVDELIADTASGAVEGFADRHAERLSPRRPAPSSLDSSGSDDQPREILAFWLALSRGDCAASDHEIQEVRAGRLPVRGARALAEAIGVSTGRVVVALFCTQMVLVGVLQLIPGHDARLEPLLFGAASAVALFLAALSCWRLLRDLYERRLRVQEGKIAEKWEARSACWVRIGTRTHHVRSRALFDALDVGVLYRTYVSAHAHWLMSIEEVGSEAVGYRVASPRPRRGGRGC